jgi:hypothetical protein
MSVCLETISYEIGRASNGSVLRNNYSGSLLLEVVMPVLIVKYKTLYSKFSLKSLWNDEIKLFCGFFSDWTEHFGIYLHRKPTTASK